MKTEPKFEEGESEKMAYEATAKQRDWMKEHVGYSDDQIADLETLSDDVRKGVPIDAMQGLEVIHFQSQLREARQNTKRFWSSGYKPEEIMMSVLSELKRVFMNLSDKDRRYLHDRLKKTVIDIRKKKASGEELNKEQQFFLDEVGQHVPEPLTNVVTILVSCPHCNVARGHEVSKDKDTIIECHSCGDKYRIAKDRFKDSD